MISWIRTEVSFTNEGVSRSSTLPRRDFSSLKVAGSRNDLSSGTNGFTPSSKSFNVLTVAGSRRALASSMRVEVSLTKLGEKTVRVVEN